MGCDVSQGGTREADLIGRVVSGCSDGMAFYLVGLYTLRPSHPEWMLA